MIELRPTLHMTVGDSDVQMEYRRLQVDARETTSAKSSHTCIIRDRTSGGARSMGAMVKVSRADRLGGAAVSTIAGMDKPFT